MRKKNHNWEILLDHRKTESPAWYGCEMPKVIVEYMRPGNSSGTVKYPQHWEGVAWASSGILPHNSPYFKSIFVQNWTTEETCCTDRILEKRRKSVMWYNGEKSARVALYE